MNRTNIQSLTPLSKEILGSYHSLVSSISKISPEHRNTEYMDGTGGKVSVCDIVAYQIGWGKLLIGWYECGLLEQSPEMPGEGFLSWDYVGLAQYFYNKYHLKGLNQQLTELEKLVEAIIAIVEKEHKNCRLNKLDVWSWCTLKSGKQWPLSKWIRVNTVAPYKKASASVRKLFRELQSKHLST